MFFFSKFQLIFQLSKILWCENIKMELGKRAINAIFSLLKKDREGNQIDGSLIRHVIDCYGMQFYSINNY